MRAGLALLLLLATPTPIAIRVSTQVLRGGMSVRVTCRVDPHEFNRTLTISLPNYASSERPIRGTRGPITTEVWFHHVPCDVDRARCSIDRADRSTQAASIPLSVICN